MIEKEMKRIQRVGKARLARKWRQDADAAFDWFKLKPSSAVQILDYFHQQLRKIRELSSTDESKRATETEACLAGLDSLSPSASVYRLTSDTIESAQAPTL